MGPENKSGPLVARIAATEKFSELFKKIFDQNVLQTLDEETMSSPDLIEPAVAAFLELDAEDRTELLLFRIHPMVKGHIRNFISPKHARIEDAIDVHFNTFNLAFILELSRYADGEKIKGAVEQPAKKQNPVAEAVGVVMDSDLEVEEEDLG